MTSIFHRSEKKVAMYITGELQELFSELNDERKSVNECGAK